MESNSYRKRENDIFIISLCNLGIGWMAQSKKTKTFKQDANYLSIGLKHNYGPKLESGVV